MRNSHTPRTQNTEGIVAKISTLTTALGEQLLAHTVKKKRHASMTRKELEKQGFPRSMKRNGRRYRTQQNRLEIDSNNSSMAILVDATSLMPLRQNFLQY